MVSNSHFVMEGPATVLAAVELALVVNGVHDQVKGGSPSAFGADYGGALKIAYLSDKIACSEYLMKQKQKKLSRSM